MATPTPEDLALRKVAMGMAMELVKIRAPSDPAAAIKWAEKIYLFLSGETPVPEV